MLNRGLLLSTKPKANAIKYATINNNLYKKINGIWSSTGLSDFFIIFDIIEGTYLLYDKSTGNIYAHENNDAPLMQVNSNFDISAGSNLFIYKRYNMLYWASGGTYKAYSYDINTGTQTTIWTTGSVSYGNLFVDCTDYDTIIFSRSGYGDLHMRWDMVNNESMGTWVATPSTSTYVGRRPTVTFCRKEEFPSQPNNNYYCISTENGNGNWFMQNDVIEISGSLGATINGVKLTDKIVTTPVRSNTQAYTRQYGSSSYTSSSGSLNVTGSFTDLELSYNSNNKILTNNGASISNLSMKIIGYWPRKLLLCESHIIDLTDMTYISS